MCANANDKSDRLAEWALPDAPHSGDVVLVPTERPLGQQPPPAQRAFSAAPGQAAAAAATPHHHPLRSFFAPKAQARPQTSLAQGLSVDALKQHGVPMLLASMGAGNGGVAAGGGTAAGGKRGSVGAVGIVRRPR
jgi:hypothetical protein